MTGAPPPVALRPAASEDAPALARLGRESFIAAFGHLYRAEDLAAFLDQVHSDAAVAAEIADPAVLYCLAWDGALAGYCKLRHPGGFGGYSDAANPITLAQLYTDPPRTGAGIGATLMEWALAEARRKGCDAVQLSVWAENLRAQRFYRRYGFIQIAEIDFWVGGHRDDELLYELRL